MLAGLAAASLPPGRRLHRVAVESPDLVAVAVTEWLDLPPDDTVRVGHLHRIHGLAAELERLALAVLLATSH